MTKSSSLYVYFLYTNSRIRDVKLLITQPQPSGSYGFSGTIILLESVDNLLITF